MDIKNLIKFNGINSLEKIAINKYQALITAKLNENNKWTAVYKNAKDIKLGLGWSITAWGLEHEFNSKEECLKAMKDWLLTDWDWDGKKLNNSTFIVVEEI
jgi:hypothetical protein